MIRDLMSGLAARLEQEAQALQEREERLQARETAFEERRAQVAAIGERFGASTEMIKVNVSGEVIQFKRGLLANVGGTLLEAVLSESQARDENGLVFFDFSAVPFKVFLSHLRNRRDAAPGQQVPAPVVPAEYQAEFANMVKFFELDAFINGPTPRPACLPEALVCVPSQQNQQPITISGSTYTKAHSASYSIVIGGSPVIGADASRRWAAWKVELKDIDMACSGGWVVVGITCDPNVPPTSYNGTSIYYFASKGDLRAGGTAADPSWPGWLNDDVCIFRVDAGGSPRLRMFLRRTKTTYQMQLRNEAEARAARVYLNLFARVTAEVTPASADDLREADLDQA